MCVIFFSSELFQIPSLHFSISNERKCSLSIGYAVCRANGVADNARSTTGVNACAVIAISNSICIKVKREKVYAHYIYCTQLWEFFAFDECECSSSSLGNKTFKCFRLYFLIVVDIVGGGDQGALHFLFIHAYLRLPQNVCAKCAQEFCHSTRTLDEMGQTWST